MKIGPFVYKDENDRLIWLQMHFDEKTSKLTHIEQADETQFVLNQWAPYPLDTKQYPLKLPIYSPTTNTQKFCFLINQDNAILRFPFAGEKNIPLLGNVVRNGQFSGSIRPKLNNIDSSDCWTPTNKELANINQAYKKFVQLTNPSTTLSHWNGSTGRKDLDFLQTDEGEDKPSFTQLSPAARKAKLTNAHNAKEKENILQTTTTLSEAQQFRAQSIISHDMQELKTSCSTAFEYTKALSLIIRGALSQEERQGYPVILSDTLPEDPKTHAYQSILTPDGLFQPTNDLGQFHCVISRERLTTLGIPTDEIPTNQQLKRLEHEIVPSTGHFLLPLDEETSRAAIQLRHQLFPTSINQWPSKPFDEITIADIYDYINAILLIECQQYQPNWQLTWPSAPQSAQMKIGQLQDMSGNLMIAPDISGLSPANEAILMQLYEAMNFGINQLTLTEAEALLELCRQLLSKSASGQLSEINSELLAIYRAQTSEANAEAIVNKLEKDLKTLSSELSILILLSKFENMPDEVFKAYLKDMDSNTQNKLIRRLDKNQLKRLQMIFATFTIDELETLYPTLNDLGQFLYEIYFPTTNRNRELGSYINLREILTNIPPTPAIKELLDFTNFYPRPHGVDQFIDEVPIYQMTAFLFGQKNAQQLFEKLSDNTGRLEIIHYSDGIKRTDGMPRWFSSLILDPNIEDNHKERIIWNFINQYGKKMLHARNFSKATFGFKDPEKRRAFIEKLCPLVENIEDMLSLIEMATTPQEFMTVLASFKESKILQNATLQTMSHILYLFKNNILMRSVATQAEWRQKGPDDEQAINDICELFNDLRLFNHIKTSRDFDSFRDNFDEYKYGHYPQINYVMGKLLAHCPDEVFNRLLKTKRDFEIVFNSGWGAEDSNSGSQVFKDLSINRLTHILDMIKAAPQEVKDSLPIKPLLAALDSTQPFSEKIKNTIILDLKNSRGTEICCLSVGALFEKIEQPVHEADKYAYLTKLKKDILYCYMDMQHLLNPRPGASSLKDLSTALTILSMIEQQCRINDCRSRLTEKIGNLIKEEITFLQKGANSSWAHIRNAAQKKLQAFISALELIKPTTEPISDAAISHELHDPNSGLYQALHMQVGLISNGEEQRILQEITANSATNDEQPNP